METNSKTESQTAAAPMVGTPTRRTVMNMMVSAAALSATSVASASADPIFAAIDAHKAARVKMLAAVDGVCAAERELTNKGLRPSKERGNCPSLDEREAALSEAFEAETEAACELVTIRPTTISGVLALLAYAHSADTDGEGWPSDLQADDDGKTLSRSWHYFLIQNLAEILPDVVAVEA